MSFSVGIIGLPNVGKSTLFKALTCNEVDISNYPFCTIDPNIGVVEVPDERLKKIAQIIKPEKVTPTVIEFVDIAGLVKGAHKGEGLGNQFLSHIREVDAIVHVVRGFTDKNIKHVEQEVDPKKDIEVIKTELLMKDLETTDKHLDKIKTDVKAGDKEKIKEQEILKIIKQKLDKGTMISQVNLTNDQKDIIRHLNFLTIKPTIYILNTKENQDSPQKLNFLPENTLPLDLKIESEYSDLNPEELDELDLESRLDVLVKTCYKVLDLVTFYTTKGGAETRAWTVKKNSTAPQAGGMVHSDFEEKFIKANVINYQDLIKAGSWAEARSKGLIRTEGKNYIVCDGDVIEFKI